MPTFDLVYERTPTLEVRASKLSDDSSETSDYCKTHPNSDQCEKPVSDNSVTIALSIVLPCLAIVAVLGYFLYRNYRKDKKESLEHDPDFDENGEATALPDYPQMKDYQEDPFHNRNSVRYPMDYSNNKPYSKQYERASKQQQRPLDPYLDSFVLPYQHQTGSKLSLDDYARKLGDLQGYQTPSNVGSRSRSGSMHLDGNLKHTMAEGRGHSRKPSSAKSPSKKKDGKQYTNIPNDSDPSMAEPNARDIGRGVQEETSDESENYSSPEEKFVVSYENESVPNVNNDVPQIFVSEENEESTENSNSPFDDQQDQATNTTESTMETIPHTKQAATNNYDDGDFTFSTEGDTRNTTATEQLTTSKPRSPRISAFNLLKNDSDNEEEENEDDNDDEMNELSPEQQEELKRMKSVYKVYFDKEVTGEAAPTRKYEIDENYPPVPDKINDELKMDTEYAKRFSNTSSVYQEQDEQQFVQQHQQYYYDQFNQQYQQEYGSPVDPQLYQQFQEQQYYNYYEQQQQQRIKESKRPLPALQKIPRPSDIRKSTLQTYTDFKPSMKNQTVTSSPTGKLPFVPIENDGVWTSPVNSPSIQSQASFPLQHQHSIQPDGYFPSAQHQQPSSSSSLTQQQQRNVSPSTNVPSASQMARSSVVMLNPVTEITKQRKFKPAGSIPRINNNPRPGYQQFGHSDLNGPESDLLPGNRKSDVRRMMNSNF